MFRWRARNFAAGLDESEHARWALWRAAALHEGAAGGLTLAGFTERIDQLAEGVDERGQALLEALVDWAEQIAPLPP